MCLCSVFIRKKYVFTVKIIKTALDLSNKCNFQLFPASVLLKVWMVGTKIGLQLKSLIQISCFSTQLIDSFCKTRQSTEQELRLLIKRVVKERDTE